MTTTNGTALNDVVPLTDTVGRSISYSRTTSGTTTTETFTLQDSNGSPKVYTITWNNVAARSPDNATGITIKTVTAIGLPNGRSYQFQYDGNGYLSTVTFPSGAYIRYTYSYPSERASGWLVATRNISADGSAASEKTTSYAYNFPDYWNYNCGCWVIVPIASTTGTDPAGGQTIHSFDGTGRETNTKVQTSSGTVLTQVQRSWQSNSAGSVVSTQKTTKGSYSYSRSFT